MHVVPPVLSLAHFATREVHRHDRLTETSAASTRTRAASRTRPLGTVAERLTVA